MYAAERPSPISPSVSATVVMPSRICTLEKRPLWFVGSLMSSLLLLHNIISYNWYSRDAESARSRSTLGVLARGCIDTCYFKAADAAGGRAAREGYTAGEVVPK